MLNMRKWSETVNYRGSVGNGYGFIVPPINDQRYWGGMQLEKNLGFSQCYGMLALREIGNANMGEIWASEAPVGHDIYRRHFYRDGPALLFLNGNHYNGDLNANTRRRMTKSVSTSRVGHTLGKANGSVPINLSDFFEVNLDMSQQRAIRYLPLLGWGTPPNSVTAMSSYGQRHVYRATSRCQAWYVNFQTGPTKVTTDQGIEKHNYINIETPFDGAEIMISVPPNMDWREFVRQINIDYPSNNTYRPAIFGIKINSRASIMLNIPYSVRRLITNPKNASEFALLKLFNIYGARSMQTNVFVNFYHPLGNLYNITIGGKGTRIYPNFGNEFINVDHDYFYSKSTLCGDGVFPNIPEYGGDSNNNYYSFIPSPHGRSDTVVMNSFGYTR